MSNKTKVILVIALTVVSFAAFVFYKFQTRQIYLQIATDVQVSSDWIEITPQPALTVCNQQQFITITIEGYNQTINEVDNATVKPDEKFLKPDVQIIDDQGIVYNLKIDAQELNGIRFARDNAPGSDRSFPRDSYFTKVRIRSDKPFRSSKIYWMCYTSWK